MALCYIFEEMCNVFLLEQLHPDGRVCPLIGLASACHRIPMRAFLNNINFPLKYAILKHSFHHTCIGTWEAARVYRNFL